MKQLIDRAGWCFSGAVGMGFILFVLWAHGEAQPKAIGYGSAERSGMDLLVAENQEDWSAIPRISVNDLQE